MSNGDDSADEDRQLESLLAVLKQVQPSAELRELSRSAVAETLPVRRPRLVGIGPWWRRSLLVPMPVAAGCFVLIAATAAMAIVGLASGRVDRTAIVEPSIRQDFVAASGSQAERLFRADAQSEFYAAETYVCGIGRLSTTVIHPISEPSS